MDETVNQNIMSGVYAILAVAVCSIIIGLLSNTKVQATLPQPGNINAGNNQNLLERQKPTLKVKGGYLTLNESFDAKSFIEIANANNTDTAVLKDQVKIYGTVDMAKKGIYSLTYVLECNEIVERKVATFVVD